MGAYAASNRRPLHTTGTNAMQTPRGQTPARHWSTSLLVAVLAVVLFPPASPASADTRSPGCDFNGDGFGDVAVVAAQERTGGDVTGAVNVLYGSGDGVTTAGDDYWTPRSKGMPRGTSRFRTVACGDFDADGFDELVIGQWGGVTVLRGGAGGLTTTAARRITFTELATSMLAAGDFNGDRVDDLVVGAPEALNQQGTVDAYYGASGTGLTKSSRQRVNQQELRSGRVECGWALVTGDFNGDGFSDVAWSCGRGYDEELQDWIGPVARQALGSATGLERTQSRPMQVGNRYDLAAGDFDGDGNDDLAYASTGQHSAVRHGTSSAGVVDGTVRSFNVSGLRVAAGDFDGDGFHDLAVGDHDPSSTSFSGVRGGSVVVVTGTADGLDESTAKAWNPATRGIRGAPRTGDRFGWAVAVTDANGDGRDDLLVGIPGKDVTAGGATISNAGAAHLLYGSEAGVSAAGDRVITQNTRGVRGTAERGDAIGTALAVPTAP